MYKKLFLASVLFFLLCYLVLYFTPGVVQALRIPLNNSDFLTPFTIFNIITNKNSSPDFLFGGYVPFWDLLVGFIFWSITHNTQLTLTFYAIFQPIFLVLCLFYLVSRLVGKNGKLRALVVYFSAIPILIYSSGHLQTIHYLFGWHIHVSTIGAGLIALGAIVCYSTRQPPERKLFTPLLLLIGILTLFTVLCDPGFLSQFIAPAISLLILAFIFKIISFRRAAYPILTLMYGTAGGLALYEIPRLWGADRVILKGSVVRASTDHIFGNVALLFTDIAKFLEGQYWIAIIWALFFSLCMAAAWTILRKKRSAQIGAIRVRLLLVLLFFPLQMIINIPATLVTGDPSVRYFLPSIFVPLFWGWPILLISQPQWLSWLNRQKMLVFGYMSVAILILLIGINVAESWSKPLPDLTSYYPEFTACLDENAARLNLHRGISHYWQSRQTTILSRTGLVVAPVYPNLDPMHFLTNSDNFQGSFDFIIIDNNPPRSGWAWIERDTLFSRYGQPATTFSCGESDILVYNRQSDEAFRTQFAQDLP
jgi:hypothetical protein